MQVIVAFRWAQPPLAAPFFLTAQQVPGLKYVSEGYTKDELRKRILDGQREIFALDPHNPPPPLYMPPWRGKVAEGELNDLVEYLMSLTPKGEKLDF